MMQCWGSGIYDNEISVEMVFRFEHLKISGLPVEECIAEIRKSAYLRYPDCVLVLADLEYKHLGYITHKTVVKTVLKQQLKNRALANWNTPGVRKNILYNYGIRWGMLTN